MGNEKTLFITGCITFVVFIGVIVGTMLYGHIYSVDKYTDSMNKCIEARGIWIPTNHNSSGACIINKE